MTAPTNLLLSNFFVFFLSDARDGESLCGVSGSRQRYNTSSSSPLTRAGWMVTLAAFGFVVAIIAIFLLLHR